MQDTTESWMQRLSAEDVPCAPVLTRAEVYAHPQVVANGIVLEQYHPQAGTLRQARSPARFSATPTDTSSPARRLGEDTRAVLTAAGFDAAEIDEMIATGVATDTQDSEE